MRCKKNVTLIVTFEAAQPSIDRLRHPFYFRPARVHLFGFSKRVWRKEGSGLGAVKIKYASRGAEILRASGNSRVDRTLDMDHGRLTANTESIDRRKGTKGNQNNPLKMTPSFWKCWISSAEHCCQGHSILGSIEVMASWVYVYAMHRSNSF